MTILATGLRAATHIWARVAEFFQAPKRNMTGTAPFHDGHGMLHHLNGVGRRATEGWENQALLLGVAAAPWFGFSRTRNNVSTPQG